MFSITISLSSSWSSVLVKFQIARTPLATISLATELAMLFGTQSTATSGLSSVRTPERLLKS